MKYLALVFFAAAISGFGAGQAAAARMTVTYEGVVTSGMDVTGVFGLAGQSLAGQEYLATYVFETSLGEQTEPQPGDFVLEGGSQFGLASPSLGAILTINGHELVIDGLRSARAEHFDGRGVGHAASYRSVLPGGEETSILYNSYALNSVFGAFDRDFSFSGSNAGTFGQAMFDARILVSTNDGQVLTRYAYGDLTANSVSVAIAVPEPATWALMIIGFSAAGSTLRRRRPVMG